MFFPFSLALLFLPCPIVFGGDAAANVEVCDAKDPTGCAAQSVGLLQMRSPQVNKVDTSETKLGKGRDRRSRGRPRPRPRPYTGGPGAPWSEEEVLQVMGKLIFSIERTGIFMKSGFFDDFECAAGPNFSQACDGKANEFCHVNICKAKAEPDLTQMHAKFVRLGFHDCLRYTDKTGGCDGCLEFGPMFGKYVQLHGYKNQQHGNRLRMYQDHEDFTTQNNGLAAPADILEGIYTDPDFPAGTTKMKTSLKESGKSRADLWALATLVGAQHGMSENNKKCDGSSKLKPECEHSLLNVGIDYPCEITLDVVPQFFTGRSDCGDEHKPSVTNGLVTSSKVPHRYRDYETVKNEVQPNPYSNGSMLATFFKDEFGFSRKETVAIMGAHALGGFDFANSMFKYRWQFGNDFLLNNMYYRNIATKPSRKQICGNQHKGEPATWAGGAGGGLAENGWWIRPLREVPDGGPFVWFHYYHRCPNCFKNDHGEWETTEERGTGKFLTAECCVCHEQTADEVDPECFQKVVHDETSISADLGLFYQFEVGISGAPLGCPGLPESEWNEERLLDRSIDTKTPLQGGINCWDQEPSCPRNDDRDSGDTMAMSDYVELFANDQNTWATAFFETLVKVLANGYDSLTPGPDVLGIGRTTCGVMGKKIKDRAFTCALS